MRLGKRYTYLGDRLTEQSLIGKRCSAVLRADGKCICSQRMSTMLVLFDGDGSPRCVLRRRLRKVTV